MHRFLKARYKCDSKILRSEVLVSLWSENLHGQGLYKAEICKVTMSMQMLKHPDDYRQWLQLQTYRLTIWVLQWWHLFFLALFRVSWFLDLVSFLKRKAKRYNRFILYILYTILHSVQNVFIFLSSVNKNQLYFYCHFSMVFDFRAFHLVNTFVSTSKFSLSNCECMYVCMYVIFIYSRCL